MYTSSEFEREAEVVAPDPLEDDRARQHLPRVAHEELEQRELGPRQLDRPAAARTSRVPGSSSRSAKRSDVAVVLVARPAQQRAHAREQLLERERLRHVVVGARVEAGDAVLDLGRAPSASAPGAGCPTPRSRRQTSSPSTPGMSTSRITASGSSLALEPVQRLAAVGRELDLVALELERAAQGLAHGALIVDN